ncbi:MAG TPA: galactokinase [Segeticoccus sp.]|uniref:galactokinase n=1 Tax=Segeticoccus sp. TaxID=2706531 RepID=UPI002D7F3F77|nr:galactokinase [Segeticoccus sp.]HET8600908.1 galactokinase [Segeticoccus sp.]
MTVRDATEGVAESAQLAAQFAGLTGRAPEGVWSAPGRVNLIGEHTDYNQGLCLPIALPLRTRVAVARRDDGLLRLRSLQSPGPDAVEVPLDDVRRGHPAGWAAYAAGAVWALRQEHGQLPGLEVLVDGAVPVGAGLSSSAALVCSVALAASELHGLDLGSSDAGRAHLAELCVWAENTIAGAPTGGMDQAAALRCRAGHALLLDCRDGGVEQVPFDLPRHGLSLLVVDTRAEHSNSDGQYAARRHACEQAARALGVVSLREIAPEHLGAALTRLEEPLLQRRTRHIVTEIERVRQAVAALCDEDFAQVGRLFNASHASMRDDFEISCAELDLVVEAALASGALGARMTGGGFGGSAIALVPAGEVDRVGEAVREAFGRRGFREPTCFAVAAAEAARRDQ